MPPVKDDGKSRNIKDFFKPFTIPKSRIPLNDLEDEIILAPAKGTTAKGTTTADGTSLHEPVASPSRGKHSHEPSVLSSSSPLSSALTVFSASTTGNTSRRLEDPHPMLPHADDVNDRLSISPSPASSQRRIPTALEVPSSKPCVPDNGPDKPADVTKASFSSISSLTSIPLSTQSSSRRIIKNGMHAVTNSDSGSADSGSRSNSSDEELEDMSTFVPRKRPKLDAAGPVNTRGNATPSMRQSARLSENSRRSSGVSTSQRGATPPATVYKHSLLNMARQRQIEEIAELNIRQMEADFDEEERLREDESSNGEKGERGRKAALADDSDDGARMILAMQRTESKDHGGEFFFFEALRHDLASVAFPLQTFGEGSLSWAGRLQDEQWRAQACLTGFLADLVAEHGLSHQLRDWLAYQSLHEHREDLREAYAAIAEAGTISKTAGCSDILTLGKFYRLYQPGADRKKTGCDSTGSMQRELLALNHVVRVLRHFAMQAGIHAIGPFVLELMYAAIDAAVQNVASLQCMIADSIECLLDSVHSANRILVNVSTAFATSKLSLPLKCRAVMSLPGCSDRAHALRRRLALELVCDDQLSAASTSTVCADAVLNRLKTAPEFQVSESTDYIQLNLLVSVLDVAIDAGFTDHTSHSPEERQASLNRKRVELQEKSMSATSEELENAFNRQIDSFVHQLALMSSRIKDAGTMHLHRTEAKHAIERLAKRLEYGVRTKPRPRKQTFGGMTAEMQRTFLNGFLNGADVKAGLSNGEPAFNVLSTGACQGNKTHTAEGLAEVAINDVE